MTPAQRLVNRIREFIHGYDQEPTPAVQDMSRQYADVCREVNARLAKCSEFLEKGMRSEAVQEALEPPAVFEQVETLSFPELKTWRNLCMDLGLVVPSEIDAEALERLQDECSTEQFLEPLLRRFRRLVHEGTAEQRVAVLRRIKALDAENPVWVENIEPLEEQELEELAERAEDALMHADVPALQDLLERLADPDRVVPAPNDLVERIQHTIRTHYEDAAAAEGERLCGQLEDIHEQQDAAAVAPLLEKWRRLERYEHFHPTPEMQSIARKCRNWYEARQRDARLESEYQDALQALEAELGRPQPRYRTLEQHWVHLQGLGRPLPDAVQEAVTRTLTQMRRRQARRRSLKVAVALWLLAAIGAAAFVAVRSMQRRRSEANIFADLDRLWQQERYEDLDRYVRRLRETEPDLYASERVQNYRSQARDIIKAEDTRQRRFAEIVDRLAVIRSTGFDASRAEINALLTEAETRAATEDEKSMLDGWRRSWAQWRQERQDSIDRRFVTLVTRLAEQAEELRNNVAQQAPEVSERQLAALREQVRAPEQLYPQTSTDVREGWARLQSQVQQAERDIAQRRQEIEQAQQRRDRILNELHTFARDIDRYETTLREFVENNPDSPRQPHLRRALHEMGSYRDAAALAAVRFEALPRSADDAARFTERIEALQAQRTSVWFPDLSRCAAYGQNNDAVRRAMLRLRQLPFFNLKTVRVRARDSEQWETLYYPDRFHRRTETDEDGEFTRYWGDVYVEDAEIYQPRLERRIFSSREYDVDLQAREEANVIPSARFARALLAAAQGQDHLDLFLIENLGRLQKDESLAPIPKAILAREMVEWTIRIMPYGGGALRQAHDALKDLVIDDAWVNAAHPRVQELHDRAEQALDTLPDSASIAQELRFNRWLLTAALSRNVRPVGVVAREARTNGLRPVFFGDTPAEAWIVEPGGGTAPNQFTAVLRRTEDGRLEPFGDTRPTLFFGQMLFAPADGLASATFLRQGPGPVPEGGPSWPHAWPVNDRRGP